AEAGAAPAAGEAGGVPGVPEHLLGAVLAVLPDGADHVAQAVHGGGGAVAGVRGGKAGHLVLDQGAGEQLLARDRRGGGIFRAVLRAVLGRRGRLGVALLRRSRSRRTLPCRARVLRAMGGPPQATGGAQAQVVGVAGGAAQQRGGGAGLERGAGGGEAE